MKKFNTKSLLLLGVLFFMISFNAKAQTTTFNAPQLTFDRACANVVKPSVNIHLSYFGDPLKLEDRIIITLSDANGSFTSPQAKNVRTILGSEFFADSNLFALNNVSIFIPNDVSGENYRLQVSCETNPSVVSAQSIPFPAYYMMNLTSLDFLVDGVQDTTGTVGICEGETKEIRLNAPDNLRYEWYRGSTLIKTTTTPSLIVSEQGAYYVQINYGECGTSRSKNINVSVFSASEAKIAGPSTLQICSSETKTLEATVNNANYTYQWFKGGVAISGATSYQYTTTGTVDQFGDYYVRINASGCAVNSNPVKVTPKTADDFNIVETSPLTSVLLPGEGVILSITHSATSASVQWYKVGNSTPLVVTDVFLSVFDAGVYYATVTDTSSASCIVSKNSQKFNVIEAKSLSVEIGTDVNYQECASTEATLKVNAVKAIGTNDVEYDLSSNQLNTLSYQWLKNGVAISSTPDKPATGKAFKVNSYTDNDQYSVKVSKNPLEATSNPFSVLLTARNATIQSSSLSNALCNSSDAITLTLTGTVEGFSYKWFRNSIPYTVADSSNVQISEIGTYSVTMEGYGCEKVIGAIEIKQFDDSAVTITPSEKVALVEGETAIATASGADSYEWRDENNVLVSSTNVLEATKEGVYTLVASVRNCTVQKTIEVVPEDGVIIVPNILSPNGDGINDTWELSNRYSFSSDTQIFIYNSNGKEVYNASDYKNNWPTEDIGNQKIFYYKIVKNDAVVKAGTISILD